MTVPVRLAVLGLGRWGVHLLRNFLALPQAQVVAVVDPSGAALERAVSQFRLGPEVQRLRDWREVLAVEGLEAVAIATPAATHYPIIKAALEKSLHVLTEKPMTLDAQECQQLCTLAQRQQRQLLVDHTYLLHPVVAAGKQVLQEHRLGALRYGYAARTNLGPVRYDVNALWDLAIHDVAIFNHWLGAAPTQVAAWGNVWLQRQPQPGFPVGLADVGWLRLIYPNQFEATVHVSWLNPDKQRRLGVVGDQGTLVFDELATDKLVLYQGSFAEPQPPFVPVGPERIVLDYPEQEPLAQVCSEFLKRVLQQEFVLAESGAIATHLVKVLAAAAESLNAGGILTPIS